ncbi:asialoglycoprotein receptor 2-like [Haliotis cracherodii]|uniref:asialoglycoprotein receptor 2-like n=1 Tax=Haliotis cracherodii TaxID=6455 RepID=UPI0039EC4A80
MPVITNVALLLTILSFGVPSNAQGRSSSMVRVPEYDNMLDERYEITDHAGLSHRGDCASLCHRDVRCVSFSYNILTGRCLLHSVHFYNMKRGVSQQGWRYFKLFTDRCPLDYVYNRIGKFCFRHDLLQASWSEHARRCNDSGGSLLIIDTPEKQAEVVKQIGCCQDIQNINLYLGGYKAEGTWRWVDGREITPTFWYNSTVNKQTGHIAISSKFQYMWAVRTSNRRALCEVVNVSF